MTATSLMPYSMGEASARDEPRSKDVLIVYLSRTGNTKVVAEIIREEVGGKMVRLELVNPYPKEYDKIVSQVDRENETDYLPSLKTKVENIQSYDAVFLGFPTWETKERSTR